MKQWELILIGVVVAFVCAVVFYAHKDDSRLRAECEARGGVLVEAKDPPLHVCVKPIRLGGEF